MRIETFTWIGHFFTEQIGNNQSGQHVSHDRLQQTILPDSVTLRASIDLALCRIRMRGSHLSSEYERIARALTGIVNLPITTNVDALMLSNTATTRSTLSPISVAYLVAWPNY